MRTLLFGLALLASPVPYSWAQAPVPIPMSTAPAPDALTTLSLAEALQLTASRNSNLLAAEKEVEAFRGTITQAGLRPNPDISFDMEDTRRDARTTAASVGIPIELGGKRQARITAAEQAQGVAIANLAVARAGVRSATVGAFFNVLVAQEGVALANASFDVANRALEIATRRVAAGKVPPLEETRARVELSNATLSREESRARLEGARVALTSLWGDMRPTFTAAVGDLEPPRRAVLEVLIDSLLNAPELVAGQLEVRRREAVVAVERSRQYPDVRIAAGLQRNNEIGRNQTLIGVSIPLPVFDRNQGNLYEARVRADQALDQYRALEIALRAELSQAALQLSVSSTTTSTLRDSIIPGAQEAYDVATKGFEAGKFGFIDVLDAQRTLFQARLRYLTTLSDAYQAAIAIDRVLGR